MGLSSERVLLLVLVGALRVPGRGLAAGSAPGGGLAVGRAPGRGLAANGKSLRRAFLALPSFIILAFYP